MIVENLCHEAIPIVDSKIERKTEFLNNAKNDKIENIAGSVWKMHVTAPRTTPPQGHSLYSKMSFILFQNGWK
jgi:hypothetical protein